jgi:hypothetical protein
MAQGPYEIDVFYLLMSITLIVLGARILSIDGILGLEHLIKVALEDIRGLEGRTAGT